MDDSSSRRTWIQQQAAAAGLLLLWVPPIANAQQEPDPRRIVKIRLEKPGDSLGVQIMDSQLRGQPIVAISKVVNPQNNAKLQVGMILKEYSSAADVFQKIQSGPYPIELEFINLAAGGDAFDDTGTTMVTPQDALTLAQQTEDPSSAKQSTAAVSTPPTSPFYSITTISRPSPESCLIQSRRLDVLEIEYEAAYIQATTAPLRNKVVYDSNAFRGTGTPYQMVLGSGDMIPGVDQGLYDMCPGEQRILQIPPVLGYGKRAAAAFRIPPDYLGLEWKVTLVSIDSTIRQDNNIQTRQEREGRA